MKTGNELMLRVQRGGRRLRPLALSVIAAAAFASAAAADTSILDATQLAERVNGGAFVYRGTAAISSGAYIENHIWRFNPDGTVVDTGTVAVHALGGYSDVALPTSGGRWTVSGNQICIQWQPSNQRFEGCYDVLTSTARQVSLVGPQILNGTLESDGARAPLATLDRPKHR